MHLAGETDTRNIIGRGICMMESFLDGRCARTPPIEWVLLGPAISRRGEGLMLVRAGRGYTALCVHKQSARAARSHVNSEKKLDGRLRCVNFERELYLR